MKLRIYDWRFRDRRLEALYVEDPKPAGVALRDDLSLKARRARELEVRGYYSSPRSFGRRYRFCYLAANAGEVDPDSVRSLRPHIEREELLWAEAVRRGWELYRDVERVSLETRVPLQAVVAILENLRERDELPVEDRQSKIRPATLVPIARWETSLGDPEAPGERYLNKDA